MPCHASAMVIHVCLALLHRKTMENLCIGMETHVLCEHEWTWNQNWPIYLTFQRKPVVFCYSK